MKHIIKNRNWFKTSIILLAISILFSCNEKQKKINKKEDLNNFTISGEIKGLPDSYMRFRMPDPTKKKKFRNDSIQVKNGKFSFSGKVDGFKMLKLWLDVKSIKKTIPGGGYFPVKSNNLFLFVYPKANVKVNGKITDFVNAYPSGDKPNNDLAKIHKILYPLYNKEGDLSVKIVTEKDKNKKNILNDSIKTISREINNLQKKFISKNPSSVASIWYISDMMIHRQLSDNDAVVLFDKMNTRLDTIPFYKEVEKRVKAINKVKLGNLAPEIVTTSTLDNKKFDLKSYRGKYVLIDFWGTWCGPCVAEMPHVKSFLEKHKDKMEVLGVNSGDSRERIIAFLKKKDYHWQQVMNIEGANDDNFVLKFNVAGFPTKFIIDPNGKILKKYTGSGEEAFAYLEELMKK